MKPSLSLPLTRAKTSFLLAAVWSTSALLCLGQSGEWRTWTSAEGATIEARLKEVRDGTVIIVGRDGREFAAPVSRFSASDRAYVLQHVRAQTRSPADLRSIDLRSVELPRQATIEGVPHHRNRAQIPPGASALRMVLDFHNIPHGPEIDQLLRQMEGRAGGPAARDLENVLRNFPVDTHSIQAPTARRRGETPDRPGAPVWEERFNAIRQAIQWNLPVILTYRLQDAPDSPQNSVVVTGYDRTRFLALDPEGSRSLSPLDTRGLEGRFEHAVIVFPSPEAVAALPAEEVSVDRAFLSQIATAIREAPVFTMPGLAAHFEERGLRVRSVDLSPAEARRGATAARNFARDAGLQLLDQSLARGNVVVLPQHFGERGAGFVLIYGETGGSYQAVEYLASRQFQRRAVEKAEVARRWAAPQDGGTTLPALEITIAPAR